MTPCEETPDYPFGRHYAAEIATRAALGPDGDLRVHLTTFPAGSLDEGVGEPELTVHRAVHLLPASCRETASRLGLNGDGHPAAQNASVVSTRAAHGPASLEVDQLMARLPGCVVGAAFEPDGCLVAVRTHRDPVPHGYRFVLAAERADGPVPMPLYASAVYGWIRWWLEQTSCPQQRKALGDLPQPPARLLLQHAGQEHGLEVSEVERAQWPAPATGVSDRWLEASEDHKDRVRSAMGMPDDWSPPPPSFDPTENR